MSLRIQPSWTGKLDTLQRLCNPALSPCFCRVCTGNLAGTAGGRWGRHGSGRWGLRSSRWRGGGDRVRLGRFRGALLGAFSDTGSGSGTDILNWVIWDGTRWGSIAVVLRSGVRSCLSPCQKPWKLFISSALCVCMWVEMSQDEERRQSKKLYELLQVRWLLFLTQQTANTPITSYQERGWWQWLSDSR